MPSIAFEIHPHCYERNYQTENSQPKEADKAQCAKGHANQKRGEKGKCEIVPLGEAHRNRMADAVGSVQQAPVIGSIAVASCRGLGSGRNLRLPSGPWKPFCLAWGRGNRTILICRLENIRFRIGRSLAIR
jgi:hypothetical protein